MPRRPLCQCGHPFTKHRGDTSKRYEKGRCKVADGPKRRETPFGPLTPAPCPCREYRPVPPAQEPR